MSRNLVTCGKADLTTLPGQLALPTQPVKKDSQLRTLPGTTWQHIFEKQAA